MDKRINRYALVSRHDIRLGDNDMWTTVGNGELCFTTDKTGLQTFSGNTLAHWAWHSFPPSEGVDISDLPKTGSYNKGRLCGDGEDIVPEDKALSGRYMFDNPHLFDLVRLRFAHADGSGIEKDEVSDSSRYVCLWTGLLTAVFSFGGGKVTVEACVHPNEDTLGIRIVAEGVSEPLAVCADFPYPSIECSGTWVADFESEGKHSSRISVSGSACTVERIADDSRYFAELLCENGEIKAFGVHSIGFEVDGNGETAFVMRLSDGLPQKGLPAFSECKELSGRAREAFWMSGAAIDLSESSDPRWFELERRIVLSQHILALQSTGSFPCSEAGITNIDPWRGQSHMEMLWWHTAHFAMWNRLSLSDSQLEIYPRFLPVARELAAQLGYKGAIWGKSVCPTGRTAPWKGNLALLWKQPHPIYFAELEYRRRPTCETLGKWAEIIEETANFMADFATLGKDGFYHLDPVMPPSELGFTRDTVFDLAYWQWGLSTANLWRKRLGLEENPLWSEVAKNLCPLPEQNGVYIRSPQWTETYEKQNYEHPDPVGVLGFLPPTELVAPEVARATVKKIWATWQKDRVWGWDFPWIAMCASRVGEPDIAVEAMLTVDIDAVGACGAGSYPYLPANGGILFAAGMMALGAKGEEAPGFPSEGWTVKSEGFLPW